MNKKLRRKVFKIIIVKPINFIFRIILKTINSLGILPLKQYIKRFPIVGKIKIHYNNYNFLMKSDGGDSIASNLYWGGFRNYEPETIKIFEFLAMICNSIFDIGANSGIFSLFCASINKNSKVYSFEPVPRNFMNLKKNKEINSFSNMLVYDYAISNFVGKVKFLFPKSITLPLGGSLRNDLEDTKNNSDEVEVDAITIDNFLNINNIKEVDLIKIDTEGTEHEVLKGAENAIKKHEPIIVCEVLPGLTENNLMDFFKNSKYKFFHITDKGLIPKYNIEGDQTLEFHNYLFITEEKLNKLKDNLKIINI